MSSGSSLGAGTLAPAPSDFTVGRKAADLRGKTNADEVQQLQVAKGSPRPGPAPRAGWGRRPLARLPVRAAGGEGPVQVARRPPGASAGRGAAAAGWGGSGLAALSCSPPAWGSAGRAGRSEVRVRTSLPVPSPAGRARSPLGEGGWRADGRARAGRPPVLPEPQKRCGRASAARFPL